MILIHHIAMLLDSGKTAYKEQGHAKGSILLRGLVCERETEETLRIHILQFSQNIEKMTILEISIGIE